MHQDKKESSLSWCQGRLQCLHLNLNWVFCAGSWTARDGAETRRGANFFPNFLFWILWILWPCSCEPNMLFMFSTIFRVLICFSEFVRCHENDDAQLKSNKVRRLFREVDEDGNGKVDFEEFLGLVGQRSKTKEVNSMNGGGGGFPNRWSLSFIFVFLYVLIVSHFTTQITEKCSTAMCMQAVGRMQNPSLEIFQKFDTDASGSLSPKEWMVVSICHLRRCILYLGWGISHLGWGISYFRRCISYLGWGISYFGWGISYFGRCIWCLGCCILHCSGSLSPMEWIAAHHYEFSISYMCSS